MKVVAQLFFYKGNDVDSWPVFVDIATNKTVDSFLGLPLWKPRGKFVFSWAIDYVACSDERWVMVGPFDSAVEAKNGIKAIDTENLYGYRVINEHCAETLLTNGGYKTLPANAWTDG